MSQHNKTDFKHHTQEQLRAALRLHGLEAINPSQLSDTFRSGAEWAVQNYIDHAALAQPEPVSLTEYELWKSDELMAINAEMGLPMNLLKPFVKVVLKLAAAKGGAV